MIALFYNVLAGGMWPIYPVDAMALMYMTTVLIILLIALRFVRPTPRVFQPTRRADKPARLQGLPVRRRLVPL